MPPLIDDSQLVRESKGQFGADTRARLVATRAAIAAVKVTTAAAVAGGAGMNNAATIALDAQVDAVIAALAASGLPNA